jgi:hypothetical protein
MKKSEMIDEIACVLLAYGTTYPQYPLANLVELSKEILKMQEEKGMLPPYDASADDEADGHEWESENES